jgi:hypothetical protein
MTIASVAARVVTMASQVPVLVPGSPKVLTAPRPPRRLPSAFVPRRRLTLLHRLRKQENNHAATSTQKIS